MGTSLTGLTPSTTYDALIKVTDNGPLSGTLKALSDGLGNDSTLSLSTTAASIAGTLAVTGNATFDTNTLFVDAANNRVGIGTATPSVPLEIEAPEANMILESTTGTNFTSLRVVNTGGTLYIGNERSAGGVLGITAPYEAFMSYGDNPMLLMVGNSHLRFATNNTERMRITSAGNVGIGTSSPNNFVSIAKSSSSGSGSAFPRLSVLNTLATQGDGSSTFNFADILISSGNEAVNMFLATTFASGTWAPSAQINVSSNHPLVFKTNGTERMRVLADGGLTFNGDTAQANALNDYEEGTWTPTTATAGYTISASNGSYTKIGRQVTIRGQFTFSAIDVLSNSAVTIGGLPFTNSAFLFSGVIRESDITGAIYVCVVNPSGTNIFANSMDGVVTGSQRGFAINENFVVAITYFV